MAFGAFYGVGLEEIFRGGLSSGTSCNPQLFQQQQFQSARTVAFSGCTFTGSDTNVATIYPSKVWSHDEQAFVGPTIKDIIDDSAEGWLNSRIEEVVRGL